MKIEEVLNEQHLMELFGRPVPYDVERLRGGDLVVCVFLVDTTNYKVVFDKYSQNSYWDVNYGFYSPSEDRIVTKPKGDVPPKQAMQVLSTVVKIVEDFIRSQKPNMISFTGMQENKLASLYTNMIKALKPKLDQYDYSVQILKGDTIDDFIIMNNRWDLDTGTLREPDPEL